MKGQATTTLLCLLSGAAANTRDECSDTRTVSDTVTVPSPPPAIPLGITHMWTTPLMRMQLLDPAEEGADAFLETLESAILNAFEQSASSSVPLKYGQTKSDRWFEEQRDTFENKQPNFLEAAGGEVSEAFETLKRGILQNAQVYVQGAAGEDAATSLFSGTSKLHMFAWASVHDGCSTHSPHVHENTAVSGVFYVAVPPGSGMIQFDDPRGLRPPFARNRLSHEPKEGDVLLFLTSRWVSEGEEARPMPMSM